MNNLVLGHDIHKFISGCAGVVPVLRYQMPDSHSNIRGYFGI